MNSRVFELVLFFAVKDDAVVVYEIEDTSLPKGS